MRYQENVRKGRIVTLASLALLAAAAIACGGGGNGSKGGTSDSRSGVIASGSDGGISVDVLAIEDPYSPASGLLPESDRRCVAVQIGFKNESGSEVFVQGKNFALFDADEQGVRGEDVVGACYPSDALYASVPVGQRVVGWVGFQPNRDSRYTELAFATSDVAIRIPLPASTTAPQARSTTGNAALPAGETCAIPSSFDFTSNWTLKTSDVRALLQETAHGGTLATILGSALDRAELRGSAKGSFVAPSEVTMEVHLGEVELDMRVLPNFTNVVLPASKEVYEGPANANDVAFSQRVCEDLIRGLIDMRVPGKEETVDHLPAYHVHIDEQQLQQLAALLDRQGVLDDWGVFYVGHTEVSVLAGMAPKRLSADLWFAQDGLWPARIEADGTWDVEGVGEVGLTLDYKVTNVPSVDAGLPANTPGSSMPMTPSTSGNTADEDSVRALVVRETDLLNRDDARGTYSLFSPALQAACPYTRFVSSFSTARSSLGSHRAEVRNISVDVTGDAAYASYDRYVDGAFLDSRTGDRFVKQNGRWYDDLDPGDC